MNRIDWLTDELIEAALERRADRVAPDGLGDGILSQTVAMRQRRAWYLRLTGAWSMPFARPAWVAIAVLVALLGLAIALALVGRRPTSPFRTGLLAYVSGGDVYLARPDGTGAEVVLHQDGVAFLTVALVTTRRPPCHRWRVRRRPRRFGYRRRDLRRGHESGLVARRSTACGPGPARQRRGG